MNNRVHLAEGDRTAVSDRALLEAAAKAAGLRIVFTGWPGYEQARTSKTGEPGEWHDWEPLSDDGDALRLAVALGLFLGPALWHYLSLERFSAQDKDDCYAHRRAIVRAAASLHSVPAKSSEPNGNDVSAPGLAQGDNTGKMGVGNA
jgi:hypothetical protein